MNIYEEIALLELKIWQRKMRKKPALTNTITKGFQNKINNLIPEKVHMLITKAIKNIVKAVLVGSEFVTQEPLIVSSLEEREVLIKEKINIYKKAAAVSGAGTGGAGFLLGLVDFPVLLSFKMKLLFDIASLYGYDVKDYRERLYILFIFRLAFSSKEKNNIVYKQILKWDEVIKDLPENIDLFDWRNFQQEYRDYIDLAKMFQLVPGIGAVVGAYANHQLIDKLGQTAINAYRLRFFSAERDEF